MDQQIMVTVRADGSVVAETKNITGQACMDWIGPLEDLLEATTTHSVYTDDLERVTDQKYAVEDNRGEIHGAH